MSRNPFVVDELQKQDLCNAHTETFIRCNLDDGRAQEFQDRWKELKEGITDGVEKIIIETSEYEKHISVDICAPQGTEEELKEIEILKDKLKELCFTSQKKGGYKNGYSATQDVEGLSNIDIQDINNHREIIQQIFAARLNTEENIERLKLQIKALERYQELPSFYITQKSNFEELLEASVRALPSLNEKFVTAVLTHYASVAGVRKSELPTNIPRLPRKKEELPALSISFKEKVNDLLAKIPVSELGTTFVDKINDSFNQEVEIRGNEIFETEKKALMGEQQEALDKKEKELSQRESELKEKEEASKKREEAIKASQEELESLRKQVEAMTNDKYEENLKELEHVKSKISEPKESKKADKIAPEIKPKTKEKSKGAKALTENLCDLFSRNIKLASESLNNTSLDELDLETLIMAVSDDSVGINHYLREVILKMDISKSEVGDLVKMAEEEDKSRQRVLLDLVLKNMQGIKKEITKELCEALQQDRKTTFELLRKIPAGMFDLETLIMNTGNGRVKMNESLSPIILSFDMSKVGEDKLVKMEEGEKDDFRKKLLQKIQEKKSNDKGNKEFTENLCDLFLNKNIKLGAEALNNASLDELDIETLIMAGNEKVEVNNYLEPVIIKMLESINLNDLDLGTLIKAVGNGRVKINELLCPIIINFDISKMGGEELTKMMESEKDDFRKNLLQKLVKRKG